MKSKLKPASQVFEEATEARKECHRDLMAKIAEAIEAQKSCGFYICVFHLTGLKFHFDPAQVLIELKHLGYVATIPQGVENIIINWRAAKSTV